MGINLQPFDLVRVQGEVVMSWPLSFTYVSVWKWMPLLSLVMNFRINICLKPLWMQIDSRLSRRQLGANEGNLGIGASGWTERAGSASACTHPSLPKVPRRPHHLLIPWLGFKALYLQVKDNGRSVMFFTTTMSSLKGSWGSRVETWISGKLRLGRKKEATFLKTYSN